MAQKLYDEIYREQKLYNKIYNAKEAYITFYKGFRTHKHIRKNLKSNQISQQFKERIMLAVTEVNGCEICSYGHTKYALEQGLTNEEIKSFLTGNAENISGDEMPAIIFAQHYADTKGHPSKEAWNRIVQEYGNDKALGVLGAIRMIMAGNAYGIAISAFKNRMKGKKVKQTSLSYELKMILSLIPAMPLVLIHSIISNLLKTPLIDFKENDDDEKSADTSKSFIQ
ncbi:MAG TPA: carboxymuconolactone decarboxylase family protein [Virgibacillus sp.]|nr:carboxymuconolactone decarboxylase family protein [Virgibacillus sp.]